MFISHVTVEQLPLIIAGLARESIQFRAVPDKEGNFTIEITGH